MAKTSKSIDSVDAGTLDGKLYDRALDPLRAKMRRALLPLVRAETPVLAAIQKRIRTPWWDAYFLWTANLGTHTFFMIFLPIIIWFANAELGRGVACLTAAGVFWSGFIKDFMCLPRPLSPPVHRLSMSSSVALEYGFPSTHATNSVSVGLYLFAVSCDTFAPESTARMVCVASCAVYVASVVLGRLYCGMHSLTDVVGGTILAYALYWTQWTFRAEFDSLFTDDGYWVFLTIPLFLSLVGIHVCFMGVLIGLFPGSWLCQHTDICVMSLTSTATQQTGLKAGLIVLLKMVLGVSVLFVWRMACKKACYVILPPIYRAFNLPHRKFEIGAR
ncbi:phosphatidic acid phosphatase type 2/haloperoxidase [Phycomyces blakesleeanus]|uniref:Phosphatidic acid phosphatase type 2/haloperoxidase n=1 Tax=Phycomyces blakesleeanus TaxID=4837 RepID=A0ABR3AMI4_PHYBL